MFKGNSPRFVPLKSNSPANPVLHIDTQAPQEILFAAADRRIRLARDLLECVEGADECDVRCITNCALMLLSEGCDTLAAVEQRVVAPQA